MTNVSITDIRSKTYPSLYRYGSRRLMMSPDSSNIRELVKGIMLDNVIKILPSVILKVHLTTFRSFLTSVANPYSFWNDLNLDRMRGRLLVVITTKTGNNKVSLMNTCVKTILPISLSEKSPLLTMPNIFLMIMQTNNNIVIAFKISFPAILRVILNSFPWYSMYIPLHFRITIGGCKICSTVSESFLSFSDDVDAMLCTRAIMYPGLSLTQNWMKNNDLEHPYRFFGDI